ncbi:sugar transferase [Enterococcus faecalis]|nr:sugar transferase [Enterococcus faecalis]
MINHKKKINGNINENSHFTFKINKIYIVVKPLLDFFGSIVGLILFFPVFLIIALAIKIEKPSGAIIYSQERIGKYNTKFKMYKFRSMCTEADLKLENIKQNNEYNSYKMFKMKDDPRITKVGKIIRKLSLDELPQLFNVLKGEMSLVGPRPPLESETELYSLYDMHRLLVKPGCTGLWQVTGRNNISFDEMVNLDIYYITQQSFLFDCSLILKTFKVILIPNAAY